MSEERKMIYLCLAHMSEDGAEQKYVKEAFDTNWVVPMGPNVTAFEKDLEEFVNSRKASPQPSLEASPKSSPEGKDFLPPTREGAPSLKERAGGEACRGEACRGEASVVCLSAGTAAVHLALLACGVGPGDEVLVQSFTFCASSHPITYLGAKPVFIGSEPDTWNMGPIKRVFRKAV